MDDTDSLIARHRAAAAAHRTEIDRLEKAHGTGVRPGWVGEEIGWAAMQEQEHLAAIKVLEANRG